jgi:DNA polymerase III sliding clamp (beta) subunit (PCNA family)
MKCTVASKDFKAAIKSVQAVLSYGGTAESSPCVLTVSEAGLKIETARNGASIERQLPCKVLREGSIGVDANTLAEMKLAGEVSLEFEKGKVTAKAGKAKYDIKVNEQAAEQIAEQRVEVAEVKTKARVPSTMIQSGARCCIYKSDAKADFDCQITLNKGFFEFAGVDHISCGRFLAEHELVKATDGFGFVLPADLFAKMADEIDGDTCEIGFAPDRGVVIFSGDSFKIVHPVIEKNLINIQERITEISASPRNLSLVLNHADLREGIETVSAAAKLRNTVVIMVKGGKAIMHAQNEATDARHALAPVSVEAAEETRLLVRFSYLAEIVKAAPTSSDLRMELYDNKFLLFHVMTEPSQIDYMVAQLL